MNTSCVAQALRSEEYLDHFRQAKRGDWTVEADMDAPNAFSRRAFLGASLGLGLNPAQRVGAAEAVIPAATMPGRLIVVFLRGAYDGLSAFIPWSDERYAALRPHIAIPAPGAGSEAALPLDDTFALHPALAPLRPLWQAGQLAVIPCAGSPHPTRSHFEAQYHWEIGRPGHSLRHDGWLNRLASLRPGIRAIGVSAAMPHILAGPAPVRLIAAGMTATRAGILDQPSARAALEQLYHNDDALAQAFRSGMEDRIETARILREGKNQPLPKPLAQEMRTASNGAAPAQRLRLDAEHLGVLMRRDPAARIGFLAAGGWDTHAQQGATRGVLAAHFSALADALLQLRKDFDAPDDVIAVISEFGRTVAENGTRGTDHGHGNAIWLIGNAVSGGRWHGRWTGLAPERLHEGRDLPVHHDFRAVFARVLACVAGLTADEAQQLFPGHAEDAALAGLMR